MINNKKIKDTFEALGIPGYPGHGTYYGESVDESTTFGKEGKEAIDQKIKDIESRTDAVEKVVSDAERRMKNTSNFMTVVTYAVLVAFTFAFATFCIDYFKSSYERFEGLSHKISDIDIRLKIIENKN